MDYSILVNKDNMITEEFLSTLDLIPIRDEMTSKFKNADYLIDRQTFISWKQLQSDAKKDGIEIVIDDAYRSMNFQQNMLEFYIKEIGIEKAHEKVALPGTSEHHTGLAIDINYTKNGVLYDGDKLTNIDDEYIWLKNNSYKYGFILRFPENKECITGYKFEPWHIRYVGIELATELKNKDMTLEEYYQK